MGTDRLTALAQDVSGDVAGSARALIAELRAADWLSASDVRKSFPNACIDGARLVLDLDGRHRVAMLVEHSRGCVLITEAVARSATLDGNEGMRG